MRRLGICFFFLCAVLWSSALALAQGSPTPTSPAPAPSDQPAGEQAEKTESQPSATASTAENSQPADRTTPASPSKRLVPLDLTPDANRNLSQEQMQRLFRVVADKDIENDKLLRDYTYTERDEEHKLDGKGQIKSTESRTYDVMELYGEQVQRLIAKDDELLSAKDAAKEEAKIQKIIDKRKNESNEDRKKREEKEEKELEEGRKFVLEIADAYNFHLVGTESLGGREAWVIDAEPRPGYQPHMKYANMLPKFHGRVWIDKSDLQWVKMDVECLDTVSWGLFLARFHKGSRIMVEQTRVNDEVWLPARVTAKIDVRLALLKNLDVDLDQTYHDYKKFRTSAKIIGVGEVKQ
jgi:hypothetical protein